MIRKDDILKMTEKGISVFRYYLSVDFKVGKNFLNPFIRIRRLLAIFITNVRPECLKCKISGMRIIRGTALNWWAG